MKDRREFLKNALKASAALAAGTVAAGAATKAAAPADKNGVVSGKTKKKEVLYYKSEAWEKFYKIAY